MRFDTLQDHEFRRDEWAARERDEQKRIRALGVEAGTCEGCYQNPCICLPDDYPCDPD